MSWSRYWAPYVPVARRRANAASFVEKIAKKEKRTLAPVEIAGREIASSFWGKAWCHHLESFSDFENRLPRGRTYVRNGSVVDLQISRGEIKAYVSGSSVYTVTIRIKTLPPAAWSQIKKGCTRSIASLIDLLQGRFDAGVMARLTQKDGGLLPRPGEISMKCSCPDYATMCKHVAAVLYGVGARLDKSPELLFTLRDVDHMELVSQAVSGDALDRSLQGTSGAAIADSDLGEIFGIELDTIPLKPAGAATPKKPRAPKKTPPAPKPVKVSRGRNAITVTPAEIEAVAKVLRSIEKKKSNPRKRV